MKKLTKKKAEDLRWKIEMEGFEYFFIHYGGPNPKDPYHKEHVVYLKAHETLCKKLEELGVELDL